jgi:methanethiol S-methyltransferase
MFWLILSVLLWGLLHSLLASLKTKELARSWLGARWVRFYRLFYNVLAALSFIPILGLAVFTPDTRLYAVHLPWLGLMILGELLAVAVLLIAFLQTDAMEFIGLRQIGDSKGSSHLTTSGLYHYVRHPLYSSGLAFIWLIPVMTVNLLVIIIALTVYVVVGAYFEERKLRQIFGDEYQQYATITPMFIPFLKGNKKAR